MRHTAIVLASLAIGCTSPPPDQHLDIVFDVCDAITVVAPDATTAQRTEIEHGLALWRARGVGVIALDGPAENPTVTIRSTARRRRSTASTRTSSA